MPSPHGTRVHDPPPLVDSLCVFPDTIPLRVMGPGRKGGGAGGAGRSVRPRRTAVRHAGFPGGVPGGRLRESRRVPRSAAPRCEAAREKRRPVPPADVRPRPEALGRDRGPEPTTRRSRGRWSAVLPRPRGDARQRGRARRHPPAAGAARRRRLDLENLLHHRGADPGPLRRVRLRTARSVAAGVDAGGQPLRDRALAVARPDDVGHSRLSTLVDRGERCSRAGPPARGSLPDRTSTTGCWRRCWGPCAS